MKQHGLLKKLGLVMASVLVFSSMTLGVAAEETSGYDMDYYSQLKGKDVTINVYNWGEYISNGDDDSLDINALFEELTGIRINYTQFDTNESLYAKLKSGGTTYDVIFPSDYMVSRMIDEDMLEPLDFENIPNFQYISEKFKNPSYDPENLYSVPYTWGTVGLIYNYDMLGFDPDSWDIMWDENYAKQILQFSNSRDAFAIALLRLGYSINTEDKLELDQAAQMLKEEKPMVQAYVMDQIFDKMQGNEAAIAPYYAGDAINMMAVNDSLRFVIPKEGTNLFFDAVCIPKHKEDTEESRLRKLASEMYINFLNEPDIAAANIEYIQYSTPNDAALALLDEETRNNPIAYPSDEVLENTEVYVNLSEDTNLYLDQLWTQIMSAEAGYNYWSMPLFLLGALALSVFITIWKKNRRRRRDRFDYEISNF
ncbi:spermidine/putrescine ABC transporter substrate-binding protein [uncultured Negativibacillus sp.]|uniref:ABC transporter substrate-binding protein n=1 Tax=uncultured Negativibacillus sp. TaxID=1980696 RepID=UPI0025DE15C1|nr:spermidine/putrescine ABC transporter substrate-binding protein [uncultured Negativibacillus sp.]